jgi:hypothetical protein
MGSKIWGHPSRLSQVGPNPNFTARIGPQLTVDRVAAKNFKDGLEIAETAKQGRLEPFDLNQHRGR